MSINWSNNGYTPGSKQDLFIQRLGPAMESAIKEQGLDIPPEGVVAQLALESGWGVANDLSLKHNNFGGLTAGSSWSGATVAKTDKQGEKAGGETIVQNFRVYNSVQEFASDYVQFVQKPRYSVALEQKDPYHYSLELGKAGYHNNNDHEYASDVAGVARKVNPAANEKYDALAKEYKDIGDKARAGKINDAAEKWVAGAGSEQERKSRAKEHEDAIAQISEKNPGLGAELTALFALILFVMGEHEAANELLAGVFGESSYGHGNFREDYDNAPRSKSSNYSYNGKGQVGGASENYNYKLPYMNSSETAGEYLARSAESFIGKREVGSNRGDFVDWTMERAGLAGTGNPWCAGFVSKIYEGTGLYNYSASSLNIMEQAASTGSFIGGTSKIDGIGVGDTIVFDRGTSTDYKGHIGIVTGVTRDSSGKITHVETVEGNKGDKVSNVNYSLSDLKSSRYIGYGDISHRAEKLNIDLAEKLRGHSEKDVQIAEENKQKENPKPVPADKLKEAQKLTAGIELKDMKIEGWPPGVDSSVLDAAKAAEANRLA